MKLRGQFVLLSAIPLLGLAFIFVIGIITLNQLRTDISHLIQFQDERAMMLNADRDAYQVQESEMKALGAKSADELADLDVSNKENLQQVWERITGPGENFTSNMTDQYERFQNEYAQWEMESRNGFDASLAIFDDRQAALNSSDKAEAAFGEMRDRIDWIGELIDTELSKELSSSRRRQLEQALSLVLNGDRDAYQAYVAQLKSFEARTLSELQDLDAGNLENIEQTGDRVSRAASIMGGQALVFDEEFRGYFETWKAESRNTLLLSLKIFDRMNQRDVHMAASGVKFSEMRDAIDKLGEMQDERSQVEADNMESQISQMIMQYLIVFIASLIIAQAISLMISNSLLRSIRSNITLANAISQGKLDVNVLNSSRKDEMGELNNVLADMKDRLRSIIVSVKDAAAYVSDGSQQLSESAQGLSAGASEQASSTEEVSASIEQMSSSIDQNTENALQTRSISEGVSRRATESGDAVKQTVEAMNEISQKINIVSEMARQTNLLALNAAIEAARAGEAGKGFAVVASEVRKLAENSQKSAVGITDLSEKSFDVADKAGAMIVGLVEDIQKTSDLVQEISASSTEQSHGMSQVTSAILQLDKVTQSNASASEEIASTAEELAAQAQSLNDEMDFFTV